MRGNNKNQVGFLKERSRQVVAVSRQKCGLYIVGHTFLRSASPNVWGVRNVCVMELCVMEDHGLCVMEDHGLCVMEDHGLDVFFYVFITLLKMSVFSLPAAANH